MKGEFELKKELSLLEVTLVGIGNILGAGIYVLMGKAAGLQATCSGFLFCLPEQRLYFRPLAIWN